MVIKWGLSEKLGAIAFNEEEGEVFLGRAVTQHKHISEETARKIDSEVSAIIERNYERARTILLDNMDKLHAMAQALVQHETLDAQQIDAIMAGRAIDSIVNVSSVPPGNAGIDDKSPPFRGPERPLIGGPSGATFIELDRDPV
jgi:cell division protease FtsH